MWRLLACLIVLVNSFLAASLPQVDVNEIIRRSVANNDANWKAAPKFAFREQDVTVKSGKKIMRTYDVTMIEGSPYQKLIALNGKTLSAAALGREEQKLRDTIRRRQSENPPQRQKRIAAYHQERRQDHALMREMIRAFDFTLARKETVNGRECYRVNASPKPGYTPPNRDTKVLTGMRGTLWIDSTEYQWVKVSASVFRNVSFGLFIAHVHPGTEFTLEEAPVHGKIWLPLRFSTTVRANVLLWKRNSDEQEIYSGYRLISPSSAQTDAK